MPLPIRRKRNAFASRVVERASIMQNHYFVNVPVDANIYVKKKKNKKLRNPKQSRKRTQQLPLMSHFIKKQPTGKKLQLSPTGDHVHLHVRTANDFKKPKYELTGQQPTKLKQLTNKCQTTKPTANIQPIQQAKRTNNPPIA